MDPNINLLLLLKNNWSLTDSGLTTPDIAFTTGWFDNNIQMPQITVTPGKILYSLLDCGSTPYYQFQDTLYLNIWVRPDSDSNKSLGTAKHREYKMRTEVERILRSGSHISTDPEEFIHMGRWRQLDEMDKRPVVLRSMYEVKDNYFRQVYEGYD